MLPRLSSLIPDSWHSALKDEYQKSYFLSLETAVIQEYSSTEVFPVYNQVFRALELCPFEHVRVVILGQDPYHNPDQAHGLAFSVPHGQSIPPSLKNIFREIHSDLGIQPLESGDLTRWAKQGVLLLNASLSVKAHSPSSHSKLGWKPFTDAIIQRLQNRKHIVYLLWGNHAQTKSPLIDSSQNLILTSGHPSPLSARFFYGNHHFSQTNTYLIHHILPPIHWR